MDDILTPDEIDALLQGEYYGSDEEDGIDALAVLKSESPPLRASAYNPVHRVA
ncbi:MAG: hypothetical protein IJ717_02635 [Treponema sp.]|nr:hypothetical protein [Treponema sp.]